MPCRVYEYCVLGLHFEQLAILKVNVEDLGNTQTPQGMADSSILVLCIGEAEAQNHFF